MEEQGPRRVLAVVSNKSTYWERCWTDSEEILPVAVEALERNNLLQHVPDPELRLLAKHKYGTMAMFVFDINNTSYDAALGHLPEHNKLPVSIVRLSRQIHAYPAHGPILSRVNNDIAKFHNLNGVGSTPPFVWDYTQGYPEYCDVRDLSLLYP